MAEDDDRLLKELYNQHRPGRDEPAPNFEAMMDRARQEADQPTPLWRRRWPAAAAAAALLVAVLAALVWSGIPTPQPSVSTEVAESVEPTPNGQATDAVLQGETIAQSDEDRWDELLEFADDVWVEEYPTDFLL